MIRAQYLIHGPQVSILRSDHQPDIDHRDPEEEVCSDYSVNFVECGSFGLTANEQRRLLSAGYLFFSRPGAVHRYSHQERIPTDVCLSVVYSGSFAEEIARRDECCPCCGSYQLQVTAGEEMRVKELEID